MRRAIVHKEFALYLLDFVTDGYSVILLAARDLWSFACIQAIIFAYSLFEVRRTVTFSGIWGAYRASCELGFRTDDFLRITLIEKLTEAPLSFLLQSASLVVFV
mmetsp:Transcript_33711/g.75689  ORF Transcript_33711/g.75689 Transcript_33711/m.75689 type:complete len:104 (+) Transcript_33711:295-606(+)